MSGLENLGVKIYDQLDSGYFPSIEMPSRSTENINYDPQLRQFILGDRKVRRSARNIHHVKPFTQLTWAAEFSHELTSQRKTSTLRDVYYSAQAYEMTFKDQQESNNIVTDLETVLGFSREDFNIFPEERSAVFGDLTIEYTVPRLPMFRPRFRSAPWGSVGYCPFVYFPYWHDFCGCSREEYFFCIEQFVRCYVLLYDFVS